MRQQTLMTIALVAIIGLAAHAQAPTLLYTYNGDSTNDRLGNFVAGLGDVDGDGISDFAICASGDDNLGTNTGSVRVHSGTDGSLIHFINGTEVSAGFAITVSPVGDLNNDGRADFAIGAAASDIGGTNSGAVYVHSGLDLSLLYTFVGSPGDNLGVEVRSAGDVNGDGVLDIICGAWTSNIQSSQAGAAYVYSGADGTVIHVVTGIDSGDLHGRSVDGGGDVNGDGFDDFMAGSRAHDSNGFFSNGELTVYSGADASIIYTFQGEGNSSLLGQNCAFAGDINCDGYDDIIAGEGGYDANGLFNIGRVRVFSGFDGSVLRTHQGTAQAEQLGFTSNGLGDINGDGYDDYSITANGAASLGTFTGRLNIYSGKDGSVLHSINGFASGDQMGTWTEMAGDLNLDGFPDFITSAPFADINGSNSGSAYVYLSPTLPTLAYGSQLDDTVAPLGTSLKLEWLPTVGDPAALTGTLFGHGAAPFGAGIAGVSIAPVDLPFFGFPLLIANLPSTLLETATFAYDGAGTISSLLISRQNPFLAGFFVYVQLFQSGPTIAASNGLRILMAP